MLDPWHYLPVLERKPGALRHGLPFRDWNLPVPIARVREQLMKTAQGDRAFVQILQAIRDHGLEPVSVACTLVLEQGVVSAPIILNHLSRLISPVRSVAQVATTLGLSVLPTANCQRYDSLLGGRHAH